MPTFLELSLILALATVVSLIMRLLRQPLIVGYIATGIIIGPYALDVLRSHDELELFSKIGISILLFIVGLTLNPDIIREVGKSSFLAGVGQVVFTSLIGFGIAKLLGFGNVAALYTAVALTFSSTIIVLKLLADRGDAGKLYGKISIGILLVQDLFATIALLVVGTLGNPAGGSLTAGGLAFSNMISSGAVLEFLRIFAWGGLVAIALYLASKHILPKLVSFVGGNQEVLFIFSIGWGLGLASLFELIGFSVEIGALIAGVMLAVSPFAYEIGSRMRPLRDFFVLIFFVLLGSQMIIDQVSAIVIPALILSAFVLIGNPLIVFAILNLLGYRTRTSFMSGLTMAQISEFSLILVALGYSLGHISREVVSLVTLVGIITIAGSTYLIMHADGIYSLLRRALEKVSVHAHRQRREPKDSSSLPEIVIFGYDRVGHEFVSVAGQVSKNYVVVDFDPGSIRRLQEKNVPFRYGDAEDVEFLQEIGLHSAKLVVSTIPDHKANLLLVRYYRSHKDLSSGVIIVIAHNVRSAEELYSAGASYVVMPHHLGAHHAALMIARHGFEAAKFAEERDIHLAKIAKVGYV